MNRTDAICLLVIILVIVGVISAVVYSWYSEDEKKPKEKKQKDLLVKKGDLITCHFTEYIWTKDTNGNLGYSVYQTTRTSVADNDSIPKSVTFKSILTNETEESIVRDKLTAIVGQDLTTEMNKGFNQLVLDMKKGQNKEGEIPVSLGYGERNESLIQKIPLIDKIPIYETINRAEFEKEYPGEVPLEIGKSFDHHYWGWMIRIHSKTDETIVIKHEPEIGNSLDIFTWKSEIENISSVNGYIWIHHKPDENLINTAIDAEALEFYNPIFTEIRENIVESQQPYPGIIVSIQNGIEIDFNRENLGKNLRYEITIIDIERD